MKLSTTARLILACLTTSCLFLLPMHGATANEAANEPYADQYDLIDPPQPTNTSDKVEVVELFWYTCPHCYDFDRDYLKAWREKMPDYVAFVHMPAVFGPKKRWKPLVKAYYVAEALDILDKVHTPLFEAVHDKKPRLRNKVKALQNFFAKYGVSEEDFTDTYDSFGVDAKMKRARDLTKRYGVNSVPSIVVNGKYRLGSRKAGGSKNLMRILDYLIEKERQLMGLPKK